jgi:hypothetical protein
VRIHAVAVVLGLLGAACSDATNVLSPSAAGGGGAAGASGASGAAGQAGENAGPRIVVSQFAPSLTAPLAGTLLVALDRPGTVRVAIDDGAGHSMKLEPTGAPATVHSLPVLQLRANRTYVLTVVATGEAGLESAPEHLFRVTDPLPYDFPPIEVVTATGTHDQLTLFPVSRFTLEGGVDPAWGYLVAVDSSGQVVWYAQAGTTLDDLRIDSAGDLRFVVGNGGLVTASPLGQGTHAWLASGLGAPPALPPGGLLVKTATMHHDAIELPNGNILALGTEGRKITTAMCPTYDQAYEVVGDLVLEIEPHTGAVVRTVSMFDLLDPCRRADAAFKGTFWSAIYGDHSADWTHANGLVLDTARNAVLVSSRHQDWVIAFRYQADAGGPAGSLLFKLGAEGDFALAGNGAKWPYHQHSPKVLPNGNLMVFDNGASRPGTVDSDVTKMPASRGVEYALDMSGPKGTWTATQVWEWGGSEVRTVDAATGANVPYYSSIIGDSEVTPQGTALITEGALTEPPTGAIFDAKVKKSARIVEVTRDAAAGIVTDLRVRDPGTSSFWSYMVFRATRVPTLYAASAPVTAKVISHLACLALLRRASGDHLVDPPEHGAQRHRLEDDPRHAVADGVRLDARAPVPRDEKDGHRRVDAPERRHMRQQIAVGQQVLGDDDVGADVGEALHGRRARRDRGDGHPVLAEKTRHDGR